MDTTLDGLLNRRIVLEQPKHGYRVAADTVFLAAAVAAKAGDKVLELGCGVGGAMLALACRIPGISITGIDIQSELIELCRRNILRNGLQEAMTAETGDVTRLPERFRDSFDQVFMNPPYHDEARHDVSEDAGKRTANAEKEGDLALWVASAAIALKSDGALTLIHRADRMDEIIGHMRDLFGDIRFLYLLPKEGGSPRRVILRAQKDAQPSVTQCKSLVMHKADGGYTNDAETILRHVNALEFIV